MDRVNDPGFISCNLIRERLNALVANKGFHVTISRHSEGYRQPLFVTFYLNFNTELNNRWWVRSESILEAETYDIENAVQLVMGQLNAAYATLKLDK